jgi:threonine aldolase
VLAGSAAFIEQAWIWKHRLGGAMRQSGLLAAAGVYALHHHVDRLAEDHDNARRFARGIAAIPGIAVEPDAVDTNLVFFDLRGTGRSAAQVAEALLQRGIRIGREGAHTMRAVTHLDVSREGVEEAVAALRDLLA